MFALFNLLVVIYIAGQEKDCYFVNRQPQEFKPDSAGKTRAKNLINAYKDSIVFADSLSLIGVSKKEILYDLEYMIDNQNSTYLNDSGYYCGIVVVLNWMLNNTPDLYVKGVIELAYNGETRFENGSKKIKLPGVLKDKVDYSVTKTGKKIHRADIGSISISDFVLGVSLVNAEKKLQRTGLLWKNSTHSKTNFGNYLFANTMPWEIDDFFRIIGVESIKKSYYSPFENKEKVLHNIGEAVKAGEMPILMENHLITADQYKNLFYRIFGAHFISIHEFKVNHVCNTISISYWDYGSVKNYREQASIYAAKSLNSAMRKSGRMAKIKKNDRYLEITTEQFFKGLKGYWIPTLAK